MDYATLYSALLSGGGAKLNMLLQVGTAKLTEFFAHFAGRIFTASSDLTRTTEGALKYRDILKEASGLDVEGLLNNPENIDEEQGYAFLDAIFGERMNTEISSLSKVTGLDAALTSKMMKVLAPLILGSVSSSADMTASDNKGCFKEAIRNNIGGFNPKDYLVMELKDEAEYAAKEATVGAAMDALNKNEDLERAIENAGFLTGKSLGTEAEGVFDRLKSLFRKK